MSVAAVDYSTLSLCLQKGLSFAAYTLPGDSRFTFIAQKNQAKKLEQLGDLKHGFIIHPFEATEDFPILLIKDDFYLKEGEKNKALDEFLQSKGNHSEPSYSNIAAQSKEDYLRLFEQFKQVLDDATFEKLVLSRVKNIQVDDSFDIVGLFEKLNQNHLNSFNHISFTPQSGLWLGSTPEVLLSVDDKIAKTHALAGTQKKKDSSNYTWGNKEIEEQKFVIDYIQQVLENQIPKSFIEKTDETIVAGKMAHLRTNFSFPSKYIKNLAKLIENIHPTPAVCGLPKEKAKQFIKQKEEHHRSYYAGFLGPVNLAKQTHLFVNLRCLKFEEDSLSLYLGGGLTKNSIAEKEWDETELKATTLESLL